MAAETPAPTANGEIPAPAAMKVALQVEGRTSTMKDFDVVDVGQQIPKTYSEGKIGNTAGFRWWVTKHFALKSDLPEADVRLYLELVELAWPHYVEAFGGEPPGIEERRIALIYGSSWDALRRSMIGDGFTRGAHAGGETMFYNRAAYSFPTTSADHRRYIVVHETAHAFQMSRTGYSGWAPTWFVEGIADSIAHHVYDEEKRSMTVLVFDRAPQSWLRKGLDRYAVDKPSIEAINANPKLERELNFLLVHYLLSDPVRAAALAAWRDALAEEKLEEPTRIERSNAILAALLGPERETAFAEWVAARRPTLETEPWTWEPSGDSLWFRDRKGTKGQVDVNVVLEAAGAADPLCLDFPGEPGARERVGAVGPTSDGGAAVGFEIDYLANERTAGRLGWGLGRDPKAKTPTMATLWLERGDVLEFDARPLGGAQERVPLPNDLRTAFNDAKAPRVAVRMEVGTDHVRTTVHVYDGASSAATPWSHVFPLSEALASTLRSREMAMLAEGGSHRMRPVLAMPTSARPHHPARRDLERLARAQLQLGEPTPPELTALQTRWVAENTDAATRVADRWALAQQLSGSHPSAAATVAGIDVEIDNARNDGSAKVRVFNHSKETLSGTLNAGGKAHPVNVAPGKDTTISLAVSTEDHVASLDASLGTMKFAVERRAPAKPWPGVTLSATAKPAGDGASVDVTLTGPLSGKTTGTIWVQALPSHNEGKDAEGTAVQLAPFEQKTVTIPLPLGDKTPTRVDAWADLEADGEPLRLRTSVDWTPS